MMTLALLWTASLLLLLQDILKQWSGESVAYLDQALVLAIFLWGLMLQLLNGCNLSRLTVGTAVVYGYEVGISLLFGQQQSTYAVFAQSLVHVEFFLLAIGFASILAYRNFDFRKLLIGLLGVTLVGSLLNALLGNGLFDILGVEANYTVYKTGRLAGFALNPNRMGVMLALGIIYLLAGSYHRSPRQVKLSHLFIAGITVFIYLTGSRTALVIELAGFMCICRPQRIPVRIALLAIGLTCLAITQSQMFDVIYQKTMANFKQISGSGSITYARWLMIGSGAKLAIEHFPIGSGAATFGSVMSAGSDIYSQLGLLSYSYIADMSTVFDSNLATILGEFGLLGVLLFYGLFAYSLISIRRVAVQLPVRGVASAPIHLELLYFFLGIFMTISEPLFDNSYYSMLFLTTMIASQQAMTVTAKSNGYRHAKSNPMEAPKPQLLTPAVVARNLEAD